MSGMRRAILLAVLVVLVAMAALPQDESAALKFLVIRDYNGKPVRNASVVMHPVEKNGKQSRGGLQIKTDPDGKANFDGVPTANCVCRCWLRDSRLSATTMTSTSRRWRS